MNDFVYIFGSGSSWADNEIRYSVRSVLKHHPDAQIHIIGEKPRWYDGLWNVYVPDSDPCPYVNAWHKLEKACSLFQQFIYMDDDFFLLEPFQVRHYRLGTLAEYMKHLQGSAHWGKVCRATFDLMPEADRHLLHVPLPIISKNFMKIARKFPQRHQAPSLVPRQIYCHYETAFKVADLPKRVKTKRMSTVSGLPFFSTDDMLFSMKQILPQLYPEPSHFEIS